MNQQRSRRFRASKEGAELTEEKDKIREEIIGRGMEGDRLSSQTNSLVQRDRQPSYTRAVG